jgi:hypothetical protein
VASSASASSVCVRAGHTRRILAASHLETNVWIKHPGITLRGPARGDLAAFRTAVDFEQRCVEICLGSAREVLRERRCRGQYQRDRRHRQPGHHQGAQMNRRSDEHPRLRDSGEFGGDIARIERLAVTERKAADQRQQHGGFEAIHVLWRHRADQRAGRRPKQAETGRRGAQALHQVSPCFAMRDRHAGRTGGEQISHDARRVDLRHNGFGSGGEESRGVRKISRSILAERFTGLRSNAWQRKPEARQLDGAVGGIVQAKRIRRKRRQLAHRFRRMCGRQQADLARHQGRAQADRETVAVRAHIEHMATGRQCLREVRHVGEKLAYGDRRAVAPGNRLRRRRVEQQRKARHNVSQGS